MSKTQNQQQDAATREGGTSQAPANNRFLSMKNVDLRKLERRLKRVLNGAEVMAEEMFLQLNEAIQVLHEQHKTTGSGSRGRTSVIVDLPVVKLPDGSLSPDQDGGTPNVLAIHCAYHKRWELNKAGMPTHVLGKVAAHDFSIKRSASSGFNSYCVPGYKLWNKLNNRWNKFSMELAWKNSEFFKWSDETGNPHGYTEAECGIARRVLQHKGNVSAMVAAIQAEKPVFKGQPPELTPDYEAKVSFVEKREMEEFLREFSAKHKLNWNIV